MKVQQIVQRKGSDAVATIGPDKTLGEAAVQLLEMKIGCLLVADGGKMVGILSERDIVRALGREAADCLSAKVSSVMTAEVTTCSLNHTADDVLGLMTDGRFRHIPVLDGEKLAGLISIGDVVKAKIDSLESENEALESMIRSATG